MAIAAGCLGSPDGEKTSDGRSADQALRFSNLMEVEWHSDSIRGPTAILLNYSVERETNCRVLGGASTRSTAPGLVALVLGFDAAGALQFGIPADEFASPASIHGGGFDTSQRSEILTGVYGGGEGIFQPGSYSLALVAPDAQPGVFTDDLKGGTVGFAIKCDAPFRIDEAAIGRSVMLANPNSLSGGLGANVDNRLTASITDSVSMTTNAPLVYAAFADFEGLAGNLVLTHPSGTTTWGPTDSVVYELVIDGPGTYTFTSTRTAAGSDHFWCAAFGIDGAYDLSSGSISASYWPLPETIPLGAIQN